MTVNPGDRAGPWDVIKSWGDPPQAGQPEAGRAWIPPGPPPNMPTGWISTVAEGDRKGPRINGGLVLGLAIGFLVFMLGLGGVMYSVEQSKKPPAAPEPAVTITGTCEKRIVGAYSLAATLMARNDTDATHSGQVWVRWTQTGKEPIVYTQQLTLAPGTAEVFYVNEPVDGATWFRLNPCEYGWRAL